MLDNNTCCMNQVRFLSSSRIQIQRQITMTLYTSSCYGVVIFVLEFYNTCSVAHFGLGLERLRLKSLPSILYKIGIPKGSCGPVMRWRIAATTITNRVGVITHPCLTAVSTGKGSETRVKNPLYSGRQRPHRVSGSTSSASGNSLFARTRVTLPDVESDALVVSTFHSLVSLF